jgi:(p)ppGpp synthase/HD superfamily hydrolase
MVKNDNPRLGRRFEEAFALANRLHQDHVRKASQIPYISHLLSVTALVLQDGGDEDEAIAALLHDAVEDQGGEQTLALIREKFGDKVAKIVY